MRTNKDLYPLSEIVNRAQAKGVDFGNSNPENRIRYYIKFGLLPHAKRKSFNGEAPTAAFQLDVVDQIVDIEKKRAKGKSIAEQKLLLENQPKVKRKPVQSVQPETVVIPEPRSNFVPRLALGLTALVLILFLGSLFFNLTQTKESEQNVLGAQTQSDNAFVKVVKAILRPVAQADLGLLRIIKTGNSVDPLAITNVQDFLKIQGNQVTFNDKVNTDSITTKSINGYQINNKENSIVTLNSEGNLEIPGEIKTQIDWSLIKDKPNLVDQNNLLAGSNIKISQNGLTGAFTISSTATTTAVTPISSDGGDGTITAVVAGNGLSGGGTNGSVSLAIDTAVVASLSDTQTFLNKTLGSSNSIAGEAIKTGNLGAAGLTLAFNSFGSMTGILTDANISNSLTLDNTSNIDAAALTSGTVSNNRLSNNVTLQGNTFNGANQLVQLNGLIQLPAISGTLLINLNASNLSSGTVADTRLSGNVTVQGNSFNGITQLVQTNGSGQLPALSGINLTNLNATSLASGTVADGRLSTNVTLQGNTFNGASQLVQLDVSSQLPAVPGALLTTLNGTNISSGTVANTRLTASVTLGGNTFNGISELVQTNGSGQLPIISGINLTNLTATNINSGTLGNGSVTLALGSFGSITGSLTDANVADTLTIGSSSSVSATAINSGTLGNAGVTLALASFGSITGTNGASQLVQLNASSQLPAVSGALLTNISATWSGGTLSSNINFNNNLATNIGAAGTNFTAGGGLNIATGLAVAGHVAIGNNATVNPNRSLYIDDSLTGSGTFNGDIVNSYYTGTSALTILRGLNTNANWQGTGGASGFEVSGALFNGNQESNTAITSLIGTGASVGSLGGTSGTISSAYGVQVTSAWGGAAPTTSYGVNIGNMGVAGSTTTYGLYVATQSGSATNYTIYSAGGTNYFSGKILASAGSTSAVGFNLNTAQTTPVCSSLTAGDFGWDKTNNRIFWKNTDSTTGVVCNYINRNGTFDIAERAVASENLQPGDLLAIDTSTATFTVKKSDSAYQQTVIGIESTDPTFIDNPDLLGTPKYLAKMALAGRVPTKVSTENGSIAAGDYLTSSSTPGVAMKATTTGPTVGKALEAYNGSGVGKILVFVNISYYLNTSDFKAYTVNSNNSLIVKLGNAAKYVWQNSSGQIVASVNDLGEAIFSKVTTAIANVDKLIFGEIAVKKTSQSGGVGEIPADQSEVVIPSNKVKDDSLINLTANSEPDGVLYIKSKTAGVSFVVGIKRFPGNTTNQKVDFNWLIVNQE